MSDLIKLELKSGSKLYDKILNKGILMSDEDVCRIFSKYFKNEKNVILDGIPRKEKQAIWLYKFLLEKDYNIKFIFLDVDEKKLLSRILKRGRVLKRKDDTKEIFKDRIKIFDDTKKAILKVYKENIIKVNGDKDIGIIEKDILKKLKFELK